MNAKKCKQIRYGLRQIGVDPTEVSYAGGHHNQPLVLKVSSGRGKYKQEKKIA